MKSRLQVLQDEIATLRSQAESVRGMNYDKIRVQSSPDMDPLATYLGRLLEAEEELRAELDKDLALQIKIFRQIAGMRVRAYADVLFFYYFEDLSLNEISKRLNYTYDRTRHIHLEALREFENKYLRNEE